MQIYTLRGVTIEVAGGGQKAKAVRPEVRNDAGAVIQSGASAEFRVLFEPNAPTPEVQAQRWAIGLPPIIVGLSEPQPAKRKGK